MAENIDSVSEMIITTRIESDATPDQIDKLVRMVVWRCPAHQAIANEVNHLNIVELNGEKIAEYREALL